MEFLEAGTEVSIMAMEITQSTRVICAQRLEFRDLIGYSDIYLWDIRLVKRLIDHGLKVRQLLTSMGGVTDKITQSTLDGILWRPRRGRVCRGSLVL